MSELRARKTRIGSKVKEAVRLMVEEGLKRPVAAERAGLKDNSLYVALRRPDVCAFRAELMRVLRESEASRTIARVATLADTAQSEHVRLGANEFLAGIEGISPVQRSESLHVHQHLVPGLTVVRGGWQPHDTPAALVIDAKPTIRRIGTPAPHPEAMARK